ncbi:MAG: hypothetical protein WCK29_01595 [archaeon]
MKQTKVESLGMKKLNASNKPSPNIQEVYELECPVCHKLIKSLNENQTHYNYKLHFESHAKNQKEVK